MDAADVAKDVNQHILEVAPLYPAGATLEFLCECGCLDRIALTMSAYRAAGGAWIDGHGDEQARRAAASRATLPAEARANVVEQQADGV